jgi:hypothetical protein
MTRPEAGAMESTRDSVLDVPQKRQKMEHALGLFSTESVLDLEKLIFDGTILPHGASRLLTGPASNSLAHTTGPLSIQNVVDPCHHCFGLFSWRFQRLRRGHIHPFPRINCMKASIFFVI